MRVLTGAAVAAVAMISMAASAAEVDLSSIANSDLNSSLYTNASLYPGAGTQLSIGGVGFVTSAFEGGTDTGVIAAGWGAPTDTGVLAFSAPEANVGTIYTVINAAFPTNGGTDTIGVLTFHFASGDTYSVNLNLSDNIRDHVSPSAFSQDAPNVFATQEFGPTTDGQIDRLDVQKFVLPSAYAGQTLTGFQLVNPDSTLGSPFLVALTTTAAPVPEPGEWAMMLAGVSVAGLVARRRKRA